MPLDTAFAERRHVDAVRALPAFAAPHGRLLRPAAPVMLIGRLVGLPVHVRLDIVDGKGLSASIARSVVDDNA